jgi:hypothetical protein
MLENRSKLWKIYLKKNLKKKDNRAKKQNLNQIKN